MDFKSDTMRLHNREGAAYLTFGSLRAVPFVNHAFSTRLGGVSAGEFSTMNLSFGRGDADENVLQNYRLFCESAGFDFNSLVASAQDHHTYVRRVTAKEKGIGITKPRDMQSVDALVTDEPGVTLVTYYADCTPLFFIDTKRRVIALAHAGWRGTAGRIGARVVHCMREHYWTEPGDILAAIGPAISKCCYEVDESCCSHFKAMTELDTEKFIFPKEAGKYMLDLLEANRQFLKGAGVPEENIAVSDVCTRCNSGLLWSHRATGGKRGGMAAFMCLKEANG